MSFSAVETFIRSKYERKLYVSKSKLAPPTSMPAKGKSKSADNLLEKSSSSASASVKPTSSPKARPSYTGKPLQQSAAAISRPQAKQEDNVRVL